MSFSFQVDNPQAPVVDTTDPFLSIVADMNDVIAEVQRENKEGRILQEGVMERLMVVVESSVRRLGAAFGDNAISLFKKMQRSELHHYKSINQARIRLIEKTPYHKLMDIEVDSPTGVTVPMLSATNDISELYKAVQLADTLKQTTPVIERIARSVSKDKVEDAEYYVADLAEGLSQKFDKDIAAAVASNTGETVKSKARADKVMVEAMENEFSEAAKRAKVMDTLNDDKGTGEPKKFSNLYSSVKEYGQVKEELLAMEDRLLTARKVPKTINGISEDVSTITSMIEGKSSNELASKLAMVVRALAVRCHQFGFAAAMQMKLEHAYVLQTNRLYKSVS